MSVTTTSRFSYLLRTFRQRAKLSQQELSDILRTQYAITLYASDISKLERGERKIPKIDYILALIKALHLSDEETADFLEAGNYPPTVQNLLREQTQPYEAGSENAGSNGTMVLSLYPPTTPEQASQYLQSFRPSWQLTEDGFLTAFNKMVQWVWMAPLVSDLMGRHVFEVFTRPWNMSRILMTGRANDMWNIKLQVEKWMEKHHPSEALERAKRIILENPMLRILYENQDKLNLDTVNFYEYTLYLQHPEIHHHMLNFCVKIWVTRTEEGMPDKFIVVYEPIDIATTQVLKLKYQEFSLDTESYIQQTTTSFLLSNESHKSLFPASYPSLIHDPFFTIQTINPAMRNMITSLAHNYQVEPVDPVGMNFFELIFSPPLRKPVEALGEWTDAVLRAMQGLKHTMRLHLQAHPGDIDRYLEKIADLREQLEGFADLYKKAQYQSATFPETIEPFHACDVHYLPEPTPNKSNVMTIESWVQLPSPISPFITITFVPHEGTSKQLLEQLTMMK